ncbi:MAG: hypothetical protein MUE44_06050 [Oscillatoriaceae cyanobacterium Prado104]|jgi:hypothetical protein|nr:hypothetical protein [Oscillatoriaceae cyanobacterium Prado104]
MQFYSIPANRELLFRDFTNVGDLSKNKSIERSPRIWRSQLQGLNEVTPMFCRKRETRNLGLVETGNWELRGSKTSAFQGISTVRARVYKDEALVSATLAGLPALLASLESFCE